MRRLKRRVRDQGAAYTQAAASFVPQAASGGMTGGAASPPAVGTMPLAQVIVYPEPGGQYSTLGYRGMVPLFTADGAAIPASTSGNWGQLVAAGRPHPQSQRAWRAPIAGGWA